jgi:hypothetical protein
VIVSKYQLEQIKMIQLRTVNKKLKELGFGQYELVKGEGYFYVCGPEVELWYTSSIYVYSLNQLSLDQWIESITDLIKRENRIKQEFERLSK